MSRLLHNPFCFPLQLTVIMGLLLSMASCAGGRSPNSTAAVPWQAPTVELSLGAHLVPFEEEYPGEEYPGFTIQSAETLDAFLRRQDRGDQRPILRIYALISAKESPLFDEEEFLAQQQAIVADYAAQRGFQSDLLPPRTNKSGKSGIVVEAPRYVVTPPACPDWSDPSGNSFYNTPSSNFGCSTARNLSLMVAHPRDLILGRTLGAAEASRLNKALEKYQQGNPLIVRGESTQ